jgi:chromosome segregation ATPase
MQELRDKIDAALTALESEADEVERLRGELLKEREVWIRECLTDVAAGSQGELTARRAEVARLRGELDFATQAVAAEMERCVMREEERDAAQADVERLREELKPYQPLTLEEADAAIAAVDCDATPMTDEEIAGYVKFATDPEYRTDHLQDRLTVYMRANRGLRYEVERLRQENARLLAAANGLASACGIFIQLARDKHIYSITELADALATFEAVTATEEHDA